MKRKFTTTGILLFIAFFFIGLFTARDFFYLTMPDNGITYVIDSMTMVIVDLFIYSLTIGLLPICCILTWKKAHINTIKKRIFSVVILLVFIVTGALIGYNITVYEGEKLKAEALKKVSDNTEISGKSETANYMFLGLIVGSITSYFLLRKKAKPLMIAD
jgi:hypothetical protein